MGWALDARQPFFVDFLILFQALGLGHALPLQNDILDILVLYCGGRDIQVADNPW